MNETDEIKEQYARRKKDVSKGAITYSEFISEERNRIYKNLVKLYFPKIKSVRFLEIGAGTGANITYFNSINIKPENITTNELLPERVFELKNNHADINIIPCDALEIDDSLQFDIVFQSTVFTSILDAEFRKQLAKRMIDLTKPRGIILWYEFIYGNPNNSDVRKVSVKVLKSLFPMGIFKYGAKVTLAPPIGKKVKKLYPFFNLFPFFTYSLHCSNSKIKWC